MRDHDRPTTGMGSALYRRSGVQPDAEDASQALCTPLRLYKPLSRVVRPHWKWGPSDQNDPPPSGLGYQSIGDGRICSMLGVMQTIVCVSHSGGISHSGETGDADTQWWPETAPSWPRFQFEVCLSFSHAHARAIDQSCDRGRHKAP